MLVYGQISMKTELVEGVVCGVLHAELFQQRPVSLNLHNTRDQIS